MVLHYVCLTSQESSQGAVCLFVQFRWPEAQNEDVSSAAFPQILGDTFLASFHWWEFWVLLECGSTSGLAFLSFSCDILLTLSRGLLWIQISEGWRLRAEKITDYRRVQKGAKS